MCGVEGQIVVMRRRKEPISHESARPRVYSEGVHPSDPWITRASGTAHDIVMLMRGKTQFWTTARRAQALGVLMTLLVCSAGSAKESVGHDSEPQHLFSVTLDTIHLSWVLGDWEDVSDSSDAGTVFTPGLRLEYNWTGKRYLAIGLTASSSFHVVDKSPPGAYSRFAPSLRGVLTRRDNHVKLSLGVQPGLVIVAGRSCEGGDDECDVPFTSVGYSLMAVLGGRFFGEHWGFIFDFLSGFESMRVVKGSVGVNIIVNYLRMDLGVGYRF